MVGFKRQITPIENKTDADTRKFFNHLESKEGLTNSPKKMYSTNVNSVSHNVLYNQYYQELLEIYEGTAFKNPEFEAYIIETYLRRKDK